MQYKIPVQIENQDPIIFWLSGKQLAIIMVGGWISYSVFQSLAPAVWNTVALFPAWIILWIAILIAVIKVYEMTFTQLVLSFIRYKVNLSTRKWVKWVDSYSAMDIWYITYSESKSEQKIDTKSKFDKIKDLDENLEKI